MSEPYVPGPDDEYRGLVEIDCSECLPPELKARFRIGKFIPVTRSGGDSAGESGSPPAAPQPRDDPPPGK